MEINWLSQILAALSTLVVGFIWYNPKVFGTIWMQAIGVNPEAARAAAPNMGKLLGLSVLFAFIATIPLSYIVNHDNHTFGHGAFHGGETALLMLFPVIATNAIYESRSWKYILVVTGFWFVCFALMGGILRIMQ